MKKRMLALLISAIILLAACSTGLDSPSQQAEVHTDTPSDTSLVIEAAESTDIMEMQEDVTVELPITGEGIQTSTSIKADERYKMAVILKNTSNPYMVKVGDGAKKAGEDMGFDVQVYAPTIPDSVEEQVSIMETVIQSGVDMMLICAVDSSGIMPGVQLGLEKGIPMASIAGSPKEEAFLRTGYDYVHAGYATAKCLAEAAGGKGGAIILEGTPGAQIATEALTGIKQAFSEYPDIEILASQTGNYRRTEGMQVMENLVQKYKDELRIVVACNDEMALGAVQALKAANVNDQVLSGGPGGNKDATQAIIDGDMYCLYNTDPFGGAYLAAVYMVQHLNTGEEPPMYFVPFPSKESDPIVTRENAEDFLKNSAY